MTENKLATGMTIQEDVLRLRVENEQLKKQIEKMKNCENCKHSYHDRYHTLQCKRNCVNFDNWELL